ncbi:MAG: homoserine kinase [Rhodothermales bacterium]
MRALDTPITVFGPASLSNLGPGFDTLGLGLQADGLGDTVEAWLTDEPGIRVSIDPDGFGADLTLDPARNTAAVAARAVLDRVGQSLGMHLRIRKGFAPGSGIGSSAASAVSGAWAANVLCGSVCAREDLVEAVLEGESLASGSRHGDNVLPALFGGLVLVSSADPTQYRRIALPDDLWIAVILPEVQILTREARAILPKEVPLRSAVNNASALAFMIDAFRAGDWEAVGHWMMQDRIVEPVRATLLPCYEAVRRAAMEAGAFGCALTGSGPAMFAIGDTAERADAVREAMESASRRQGIGVSGFVCRPHPVGVCRM